jgi:Transmembrane secretion effector
MIIMLSVIVGVTDAFSMPSFQSIVPSIVAREQIGRGLALNSTQFNLSRILGPAIAGVLMSSIGAVACFIVSAASYVPFIGVALWILPRWAPGPSQAGALPQRRLSAAIADILRQRHLRGALLTVLATSVFCAPLVTFSSVLVKGVPRKRGSVLDGGGVVRCPRSAWCGGLAQHGAGGRSAAAELGARAGLRRGVGADHANPWFWGMPPLLILAGASMTVSNTAANSLLQTTANPHLLGQTVSLYMLAVRGGISIGVLLTGAAAGVLGIRHALLLNGLVALVVQAALARMWFPASVPEATAS